MKIQSINNYQQNKTPNFNGKLILPEKMSEIGKQFVDRCGERITKILEPEPYDMFLHELPVNKRGDKKIILAYKEDAEPKFPLKIVLNNIISEFNRQLNLGRIKLEFNRLLDMRESVKVLKEESIKQKPYTPLKIGKPQKPFIKRKKYY